MASSSSAAAATIMCESVFQGLELFEGNKKMLLMMALMEETQEDDYCEEEDDRLMSMIQALEAELSSTTSYDIDMEVGQVDDQDCSTSSILSSYSDWNDWEVASASSSSPPSTSSFDEDMTDAWSLCAAAGDDSGDYYSSVFYYDGILLENYLSQEVTDVV